MTRESKKNNEKKQGWGVHLKQLIIILSLIVLLPGPSSALDSVCATVKIEIRQELTLERQAFDAHMRISNGLSHVALKNIKIDVVVTDEDGKPVRMSYDPEDTEALFFIRLDTMENIDDVGGSGSVSPSTAADIHWMMIPAPGASNGVPQGTLYYVGATLSYTLAGKSNVTKVNPDYIFVKPMPKLVLDYFLPNDVYGDDAFTADIEPSIPFSLGLRVRNNGPGKAKGVKVESAQPKIIENEQGLLVGFVIEESEVNGNPASKSLRVDFGEIKANECGVARWIMTCSLSGRFSEFEANFSHSDELGGKLTSLIEETNTHTLVHEVLVDLPGRDPVQDFLTCGSNYMVYESDNLDSEVTDVSSYSTLEMTEQEGAEITFELTTAVTGGFSCLRLSDPYRGEKIIKDVVRSDGKSIRPENVWLSKTRNKKTKEWEYFFNLFDMDSTGMYILTFDAPEIQNQPPVLQFIEDKTIVEGERISFLVEASDDTTVPVLSAEPLPAGAKFTEEGSGQSLFDWTTSKGQAGQYMITFKASDGVLESTRRASITVKEAEIPVPMDLQAGWSMISLPNIPDDASVSALFPDAVVVYGYEKEKGYVRVEKNEDMEPGGGYWILFNNMPDHTLTGLPFQEYLLPLNEDGWHMIGGCSYPAKASVDNGTIVVIYRYVQGVGYQRVHGLENLEPGQGYWILVNDILEPTELRVESQLDN